MILDLLMPTQTETETTGATWARAWLTEVSEARKALERAERVAKMRRDRAYALPDPLAHPGGRGKGGVSDRMRAVDEMVDGEAASDALDWARDALALFDHMADVNKRILRGALLDGLDIAELRYAAGCSDNEICTAFQISRSKLYNDLNAFVDYLDYIGPEAAFNVEVGGEECAAVGEAVAVPTGPHAEAYESIYSLARG